MMSAIQPLMLMRIFQLRCKRCLQSGYYPGQAVYRAWLLVLVQISVCSAAAPPGPATHSLGSAQLAVIVNEEDPLSKEIAAYYVEKRHIPVGNIVPVRFAPGQPVMRPKEFSRIMASVTARVPASIQAYVLTWTNPYRVGCMSITTAFAAGYHEAFCAKGCKATLKSPYFDSDSHRPYDDFSWRPTMMLAGNDLAAVRALIDRGVAADGSRPQGRGYLVSTADRARNARARFYSGILLLQSDRFDFKRVNADALRYRTDVMFYFTGLAKVEGIATNTYLPGAIADHLTSAGGKLTNSGQMSSLRWLEAGATGSYGTVVEPCSFVQKFPRPDIVIDRYLDGETLLEAYWKSVAWPGQGVFIGEPLAAPFRNPP